MRNRVLAAALLAAALSVAAYQQNGASTEQKTQGTRPAAKLIVSFDGLAPQGPVAGSSLAAGPDRLAQISGAQLAVFDKAGKPVYGPVNVQSIFKGFGGICEERNDGAAAVRYDQLAGRWLYVAPVLSPIAGRPAEPYSVCYAVSTGGDPAGPFHRYEFRRKLLPGHPRPAIWPDGYYLTSSTAGDAPQGHVCAADRTKMLAGKPATEQCVVLENEGFPAGADLDGTEVPPTGSPYILMAPGTVSGDAIHYWSWHVDWSDPKNTRLSDPAEIPVAPYRAAQTALARLVYRNSGGRESLVTIHPAAAGGGVRWYEFRLDEKRAPRLLQQGAYAPDAFSRGSGSAGMDKRGGIAVAYPFSGANHFPGLRFAGRLPGQTPGTLELHETALVEGEGAPPAGNRQDDYAIVMDPADDCTFWYAGDYGKQGAASAATRVVSFRLPGCLRGTVSGAAYMDVNHNGRRDKDEPGVAGREVPFSGAETGKTATGADGSYRISLPADPIYADPAYTVGTTAVRLEPGQEVHLDFPQVCSATSSGAEGLKFWLGSKGQDAVDQHYGGWRKLIGGMLYLSNGDGTRFIPKRYVQLRTWLHKPPSPLMASLVVAGLNAETGNLDGKAGVEDPVVHDWVTIHDLIKRASDALQAKKGEPYKALLEQLNNNTATITPTSPQACH